MNNFLHEFEKDGFVILPQFISISEIDEVFNQVKSVLTYVCNSLGEKENSSQFSVDQLYYRLKEKFPRFKGQAYDLIQHLDSIYRISTKKELINFIQNLAKTPLLIDYTSIRIDDTTNDRLLPFHQEFFGQISAECITAWAPLQNITEASGGLRVVPGSHKFGPVGHKFYDNYHGVKEEYLKNCNAINVSLKKGDVLVFHPNLFHGSIPSAKQSSIRWTIVTRYNPLSKIPYIEGKKDCLRIEQLEYL